MPELIARYDWVLSDKAMKETDLLACSNDTILPTDVSRALASLGSSLEFEYDLTHLRTAEAALGSLSCDGKTISKAILSDAVEYARDVLGSKAYAPWLWVYAASTGGFREGWIPDNYYGRWVVPNLKGDYGPLAGRRASSSLIFGGSFSPDLAYQINGRLFDSGLRQISGAELKERVLNGIDEVVVKLDRSKRGNGIFFIDVSDLEVERLQAAGDLVLQRRVRQHASFDQFLSGPVSTLRLTTVVDDHGGAHLRSAMLRLPLFGQTHVMTVPGLQVAVELRTGYLLESGLGSDWRCHSTHPDSGFLFSGFQIPNFAACREAVLLLHSKVPFLHCVGWDMAVDEQGAPVLLEVNAKHNGITFAEATTGPCFSGLRWEQLWQSGREYTERSKLLKPAAWQPRASL